MSMTGSPSGSSRPPVRTRCPSNRRYSAAIGRGADDRKTMPPDSGWDDRRPGDIRELWPSRGHGFDGERRLALRPRRSNVQTTPLVSPPVALAIDVVARILAEVGRADDEDLEALWPGLVA